VYDKIPLDFFVVFISRSLQNRMSFCVLHTTKPLKNTKDYIFFLKNKIHGIFFFACILDLIIGLLNPSEFDQIPIINKILIHED
jgi:hypothetical protein